MLLGLALIIASLVVALDRVTKLWLMRLPNPESFSLSWIITRTHHQNHGLIANLPVPQWIILLITLGVLVFVAVAAYRALLTHRKRELFALALVTGGAIGNLWDRIQWGYVFDWILVFQTSILNIADIAIAIGLIWYVAEHLRYDKHSLLDEVKKTP